jgi:hypothetical protein
MIEGIHPLAPPRRRALTARAALAALLAVAAACGGGSDRPRRPQGSAVWVDPAIASLTPEGRRTLDRAGLEEVFLEAATVSWPGGGAEVAEVPSAFAGAVPRGTPVTLVIGGEGAPVGADPERAAGDLDAALRDLRHRAEGAGLFPVGVHFDLGPAGDPAAFAAVLRSLRALRGKLGGDLLLSASVPTDRLGSDGIRSLAGTVDYVVAFLYGQAPGVRDDPAAWDPQAAAAQVTELEDLGTDYVVGIHVVGRADHLGAADDLRTTTTEAALKPLAMNPSLRLSIDDAFAGVGRLVTTFQAQGASRAAGWQVAPGDRIRVVRTAPALLRDFMAQVEATEHRHHSGYLFHRLAGLREELSLAPAELAAALAGASPRPELHWKAVVRSRRGDSVVLTVELENRSPQRTDLAATDGNYLELQTRGGFFESVDPGAFSRYTLWRGDQEARPGTATAWREPDRVRLYTPMVAGRERIGGAVLTLRVQGGPPTLFATGRFFLPDGSELEIPTSGGAIEATLTGPTGAAQGE